MWKLTDFGLTVEGSTRTNRHTEYASGTQGYRAPELLRLGANSTSTYTNKVDIWSMGCILFELTTRNKAFESDWAVFEYCASQKNIGTISNNTFDGHSIEIVTKHLVNMLQISPSDRPSASSLSTEFSHECQAIQVSHLNVHAANSSITVSAISDDPEQTQSMIQNRQVIISDRKNSTPILPSHLKGVSLHSAAAEGDIEAVKVLVKEAGTDVESQDSKQMTPLSWAAANGHLEVVKYLVKEAGTNVESKDLSQWTPLGCAALNGHLDVVKWLVKEAGAKVRSKDYGGHRALSWAAVNGRLDIVKYLVKEAGAKVESKDFEGYTPLSRAAVNGHLNVVKYLVKEAAANVESKDLRQRTPLSWAARNGHLDVVKFLVEEGGANVASKDEYGETALNRAWRGGHRAVAAWLESRSTVTKRIQRYFSRFIEEWEGGSSDPRM